MVMKSSGSFRLADNVRLAVAVQFKPYVAHWPRLCFSKCSRVSSFFKRREFVQRRGSPSVEYCRA
jgi:hypothetical protein